MRQYRVEINGAYRTWIRALIACYRFRALRRQGVL